MPGVLQLFAVVCLVIACVSCIAYHVIMCISFAYMFVSCIQAFSLLSVLHSGASISSGAPFYLFSCVGVKHFRIGPSLAKRPWFTTGRPPVKFRAIWTSFILQRLTEGPRRPRVCCSPIPFQFGPKPSPSSRAFDHDRVAENRTSFGVS